MKMEHTFLYAGGTVPFRIPGRPRTAVWDGYSSSVRVYYEPGRESDLVLVHDYAEAPEGFRVLTTVASAYLTPSPLPITVSNQVLMGVMSNVQTYYHVYWRQCSDRTR